LAQTLFLLLALAFDARRLLLPSRTPGGDLLFQLLFLPPVILHHLVERGSRHVDLMQPLQFPALQFDGLPHRCQQVHLLH